VRENRTPGSVRGPSGNWRSYRDGSTALIVNMSEDYKYRTFWRRFWAGWIDSFIIHPIEWINPWVFAYIGAVPLLLLWYVLYSFAFVAYSVFMHARYGQTIGKMVCGVVVRDLSEAPLSVRQAALRDIVPLVLLPISLAVDLPDLLQGLNPSRQERFTSGPPHWLTLVLGSIFLLWSAAEVITMLTNKKRRAVHDLIAGSVVIRKGGETKSS